MVVLLVDVESLLKEVKGIVDIILKTEGNSEAGDDKKAENLTSRTAGAAGNGESGKLFASANAGDSANTKKSSVDACS